MSKLTIAIILGATGLASRVWPEWDGVWGWGVGLSPAEAKIICAVYVTGALVILTRD
jgi:hypothetical protein